jgi:hypothetical protein
MSSVFVMACSVCGAGQEGAESSWLIMTAVISLLPLGMIGGVATWLWRASKERDAEQAEPQPASAPTE